MDDSQFLSGLSNINDFVFEDQISTNMISLLEWTTLNIGGFFNVKRGTPKSVLKHVKIPGLPQGRVWESSKANWVWENNINYHVQPTQVSGVYVNNVLTTTGYYIDYKNGRVIFDAPLVLTTNVEVEYSYRMFNFYESDSDWFIKIFTDPANIENLLSENRVHLPAVIIEMVGGTTMKGLQLGDYTVIENQPVLFHIIADRDEHRNKMVHILKRLHSKGIILFDLNKIAEADEFSLNTNGSINSALKHPELVNRFAWKKCSFSNVIPQQVTRVSSLFMSVVRIYLQVHMP